jgi:hypothetical protein
VTIKKEFGGEELLHEHFEDLSIKLGEFSGDIKCVVAMNDYIEDIDIGAEKNIKLMKVYLPPISRSVSIVEQSTDDSIAQSISDLCTLLMVDFEKKISCELESFCVHIIVMIGEDVVYYMNLLRVPSG